MRTKCRCNPYYSYHEKIEKYTHNGGISYARCSHGTYFRQVQGYKTIWYRVWHHRPVHYRRALSVLGWRDDEFGEVSV